MDLASLATLNAGRPRRSLKQCGVAYAREVITLERPDELENYDGAIANPNAAEEAVAQAVWELIEVEIAKSSIQRHRRGDCACERKRSE